MASDFFYFKINLIYASIYYTIIKRIIIIFNRETKIMVNFYFRIKYRQGKKKMVLSIVEQVLSRSLLFILPILF